MRAVLLAFVAGMLAVFTPAVAQAPAWQTYTYAELGYSIQLPVAPQRNDDPVVTPRGTMPSSFISSSYGALVFGLKTSNYTTATGGAPQDGGTTAQNAMNGVLQGRTVLTQSSFDVPDGGGRESISSANGLMVRTRIYYVTPRLFIVMAAIPDSQSQNFLTTGAAATYFNSFTLLPR
ncbi:MAG TPA: hypothetical protein VGG48_01280 [Rhizomicrobium sp.]|jgi:hypothetical protein